MPQSTLSLNLSVDQLQVLVQDAGIDPTRVYAMNNDNYRPPVSLPAYTNGHYVFFTDGTPEQHGQYIAAIFGILYAQEPLLKSRGITVYGGPTAQFIQPENLIHIVST